MAHQHYYEVRRGSGGQLNYALRLTPEAADAAKDQFYQDEGRFQRVVENDSEVQLEYRNSPRHPEIVQARVVAVHSPNSVEHGEWFDVNELPEHPLHQSFRLYDETDRNVLSDLLEEGGRDEEAERVRRLIPDEWINPNDRGAHYPGVRWEGNQIVRNGPPEGYED